MKSSTHPKATFGVLPIIGILLSPAPLLAQGSLTPPGPPAPTMKTLTQVEPRIDINSLPGNASGVKVIDSPGSYYLTGNLAGEAGKSTILVTAFAGRAVIDLNGFGLTATPSGQSAISLPFDNEGITIRNGHIKADADPSTLAVGGNANNVVCVDLQITSAGANAISLGADGTVEKCRIANGGIRALGRTIVRDCIISAANTNDVNITLDGSESQVIRTSFTAGRGQIAVGERSLVADCQIKSGGHPTTLSNSVVLQVLAGSIIRGCTVDAGTTVGSAIGVGDSTLVSGCRITSAFRDGISGVTADNVTIESCVIQNFGRDGIILDKNFRITGCQVTGTGSNDKGIEVFGPGVISECTTSNNGSDGILANFGTSIEKCNAHQNGGSGIVVIAYSVISHCHVTSNAGAGISASFEGVKVSNCVAQSNGSRGFSLSHSSSVTECIATENTGDGIRVGNSSKVSHSTATGNTSNSTNSFGISAGSDAIIESCTASDNTNTNATPSGSTGGGISVASDSVVRDCVLESNKGDGILATANCRIIDNHCVDNGSNGNGAGIHTTSIRNRIERNTVATNDRGIDVDNTGSIIIGNNASANSINYEIAANNRYGPIIAFIGNTAAVSGSSTPSSTMTTTDPFANFSF